MGLFARKPQAAPAAPAKRGRSVTCGALNAAIAAVTIEMADCKARRTLEALYSLTGDSASSGDLVKLDGPAPVTLAQLDDALAEAPDEPPAGTLASLTRVRALIAEAEKQAVAVAGEPVTRAEFNAFANAAALALVVIGDMLHEPMAGPLDLRLKAAAQAVEFELSSAGIQALLDRIAKAHKADGARKMRRASGRLNVVPGANGRNF